MSSNIKKIEDLQNLKRTLNNVSRKLSEVKFDVGKISNNNASAFTVDGETYKGTELDRVMRSIEDEVSRIRNTIIPSLEDEIEQLQEEGA